MAKYLFLIDNLKGGGAEKAFKIITERMMDFKMDATLVLLENQLDYELDSRVPLICLNEKINKFNFFLSAFKFVKNTHFLLSSKKYISVGAVPPV